MILYYLKPSIYYPLSAFLDEEQFVNILHSKYGDELIVCEEYGEDSIDEDIELIPPTAIELQEYKVDVPSESGTYNDPPQPGEFEWKIYYKINFADLIEYLDAEYGDLRMIEFFFKNYVLTPSKKQLYIKKAIERNKSGKYNVANNSYYKAYREIK